MVVQQIVGGVEEVFFLKLAHEVCWEESMCRAEVS